MAAYLRRRAVEDAGGVDLLGRARARGEEARRVRVLAVRNPCAIRGEGMGAPPSPGRSPRSARTSGSGRPVAASRVAYRQQLNADLRIANHQKNARGLLGAWLLKHEQSSSCDVIRALSPSKGYQGPVSARMRRNPVTLPTCIRPTPCETRLTDPSARPRRGPRSRS